MTPAYRSLRALVAIAAGLALLAGAAQVLVPWAPVPTSWVTFAMALVALLGGVRIGLITTGLYVALAHFGPLPARPAGIDALVGVDAPALASLGYLVGLMPAAVVTGWIAHRDGLVRMLSAAFLGHAIAFGVGAAGLYPYLGPDDALQAGLRPYFWPSLLTSLIAAILVNLFRSPRAMD